MKTKIKIGAYITLLLTDRGEVYTWDPTGYTLIDIPTKIDFSLGIPIKYISAGIDHAAAIDFNYNVYLWGDNYWGQLGLGDKTYRSNPTIIENLTEKKVEKICCTQFHTIALTQNGEVYSWGRNYMGELGIGTDCEEYIDTPTKIKFPDNTIIKKIFTGLENAFAIDATSNIYSWGYNNNYQLCTGSNAHQNKPLIASMLENYNVKKIICLASSTVILADNKLLTIGFGHNGELGLGLYENTGELIQIKEGVENVWGHKRTVFCKMMNGDIYAWGLNNSGQLGIGNKEYQNTPVKLNIHLDIKCINYNNKTVYAITTNGEIYTWGKNELVKKESILEPTFFTYFMDNGIETKRMNRIKSARKND